MPSEMVELVEFVAKSLVQTPEAVDVTSDEGDNENIELRVAAEDRGRVIGKNGRTAHALRVLLTAAARGNSNPTLTILD